MIKHSDLIVTIARRADIDRETADTALRGTLQALADSVDAASTQQLLASLPPTLRDLELPAARATAPSPVPEFLSQVTAHDELDPRGVRRRVWAVLAALGTEAGTAEQVRKLLATAGEEYERLLPAPEPLRTETGFVSLLRERAGLDSDAEARQAISATLAALGRELSEGQAGELRNWLPSRLRDDLSTDSAAEKLRRSGFLNDIAARRSSDTHVARSEASAVLGLLREAAPEARVHDLASQLPEQVSELLR